MVYKNNIKMGEWVLKIIHSSTKTNLSHREICKKLLTNLEKICNNKNLVESVKLQFNLKFY